MDPTAQAVSDSAQASAAAAPPGYRWRLLAALWLIVALVVALPIVGAGVVNAHMAQALGLDRSVLGAGFGLFVVMMGVPAPLVAVGVRRFGVKPTIVSGCALVMTGSLLLATVVGQGWQFMLSFGVLVGAGVAAAGVLPAQAAVTRWFVDKRALALSIVLSAIDIGGIAAAPLLEHVISRFGGDWRAGWVAIFVLACAALVAALFVIRHDGGFGAALPAPVLPPPGRSPTVHKTTHPWTPREAVHTRAFWCILYFNCTLGMGWVLLMAHGVIHLRDVGFSPAQAAQTVAMLVTASLAGNLLAGALGDRVPPHRIAAVSAALFGLGLYAAVRPTGLGGLVGFAVPAGLGYGASQVCLMAVLGNYYGARAFPPLFGVLLAVGTLLASVLAGVAGFAFDTSGSYTPAFHLCVVLAAAAALLIAIAAPPQPRGA
jgi:MFS family permease